MKTTSEIKEEYSKGNLSDSKMLGEMIVATWYGVYEEYKDTIGISEKELLLNMKEEFLNMGGISDRSWGAIYLNNYSYPVLLLADESTFLDKLDKRLEELT